MDNSIEAVEACLTAGELTQASDAFAKLRPGFKSSLDGLKLSTRIHFAAGRLEQVDVLCRILRQEYPTLLLGFAQGAESLHLQGRNREAIGLLNQWQAVTAQPDESVLASIERYRSTPSSVGNGQ